MDRNFQRLELIAMHVGLIAQLLSFDEGYRQAGVSRYIEYLLRYLPDELGEGDRLTAFAGQATKSGVQRETFRGAVDWSWTRWPTGKVPVRILWEQVAAPVSVRQRGVDLVHGPVNVVPLLSRIPSIVTIHDLAFLEYPEQYPAMQRRYLTAMTRASTRKASRVITVSEYTGRDVAERLAVSSEKIVAVPNGLDERFFPRRGTPELEAFRLQHNLPEAFLLFVGTLQPRKNLIGLLRAFALLPEQFRIPLYIVGGEGWMYSDIFDEVRRLGINDAVHFAGYAASEVLPLWYSAATAFIYPSFYEGFGLPVLEAMACGVPVITSNRTALPEVVGDAGLLVDPEKPDEIAAAISTLLDDSALHEDLASRGIERAGHYSWRRTAQETAAVYRDVMNAG